MGGAAAGAEAVTGRPEGGGAPHDAPREGGATTGVGVGVGVGSEAENCCVAPGGGAAKGSAAGGAAENCAVWAGKLGTVSCIVGAAAIIAATSLGDARIVGDEAATALPGELTEPGR